MALTRREKEALVEALREKIDKAPFAAVVSYTGLDVGSINEFRQKLRDVQGELKVTKNTLLKIAAKGTQMEEVAQALSGPNRVIFAYDDPVAVAKAIVDFQKDNEKLEIRTGVLNGQVVDAEGILALSKLPSREVLLTQLLSVLVATPTGLVSALAGIPRKLLYALKAIGEQKGE